MPFAIRRGLNLSHWLSEAPERSGQGRSGYARDDVDRIAGWGFDHIRLPVDEERLWTRAGAREQEAFDLLGEAIGWCGEAGLRVVVDLHRLRSHNHPEAGVPLLYADPAARRRFVDLWLDLSEFLGRCPLDQVAYELLNEPVAPTSSAWNETWRAPFDALREREPHRVIVLGSNRFSHCRTFPDLEVPDDEHLVLTFHYYSPMFITHYTAPWWRAGGSYAGPIRYPGRPIPENQHIALERLRDEGLEEANREFGPEVMRSDMAAAIDAARGLPLYCGEFGCYESTPEDIRGAWYRDIVNCFAELGIAWANRAYSGGFGVFEDGRETPVCEWLTAAAAV